MDRETAKQYVKDHLEDYLRGRGIDPSKPFRCLNPDHEDKHPSMKIDRKSESGIHCHCFSCGAHYDTFDLIGIEYGLTDSKAIFKKAYEVFNITIDQPQQSDGALDWEDEIGDGTPRRSQRTSPRPAQPVKERKTSNQSDGKKYEYTGEDLTGFYLQAHDHITETDYLTKRGISWETADRFKLGYIAEWRHPKIPTAPATPRLIIPVTPYSYIARDTRDSIPPEQEQGKKSKVKTVEKPNWTFNAEALQTAQTPVWITEGELDAMSIIEAGGEAVGLGSTSYLDNFLARVNEQRPAQPLILALDNDSAGATATTKLGTALKELGITFYVASPYSGHKDANEALLADREAFKGAITGTEAHVLEQEQEKQEAIRAEYLKTSTASHIQEFLDGISASVDTPAQPTGFTKLDSVLDGGLYEGLYIIGAITSLGKTTLALQMADQIAQSGKDVLIFSLEMARSELMSKSISRHTLLEVMATAGDTHNAKTARGITAGARYEHYNRTELELIEKAVNTYGTYAEHIFVHEGIGELGTEYIRGAIQKHVYFTGKAPVVLVDYLQILAPHDVRASDKQNTDKAVLELKRISRDFKTPVIAVSSFNRTSYQSEAGMEAFKESGAIEYGSDVLIGLQLKGAGTKGFDSQEAKKKDPREVELVILKNRNGRTGDKLDYRYYPMFNYFMEEE